MAKTMTWELALAQGATAHEASSIEVSVPQVMGGTQANYYINENYKKMLE